MGTANVGEVGEYVHEEPDGATQVVAGEDEDVQGNVLKVNEVLEAILLVASKKRNELSTETTRSTIGFVLDTLVEGTVSVPTDSSYY